MICPRCLENNPESYRFCGMCGSVLASAKPAAEPEPARASEKRAPAPVAPPEAKPRPAERVQPGGPSLLGLNQPSLNQPGASQPNADSLYDTAFSSMESYFEPAEPKPAWRRILVTLAIVAALGGVAWWGYDNLGRWREGSTAGSPQATNPGAGATRRPPAEPETKNPIATSVAPSTEPREAATPGGEKSSNPPAKAGTSAAVPAVARPAEKSARQRKAAAAARKSTTPPKSSVTHKSTEGTQTAAHAVAAPAGADALFRKGEAYLYGRGVPKNCDQAIKYLKLAAEQSSAKARSAFGTMYATGHCVPRDLPTSYHWFAQALRVDPNNQILEKDLRAVWNQMTPPERQLATKLRQ